MEKYTVNLNGREIGLKELSAISGIHYDTLLRRIHRGQPLLSGIAAWRMPAEKKETLFDPDKPVGSYPNGYTFNELAELYKGFAGQPDELRIIMDFTGLRYVVAKKLLEKLRENAEKNRRV